MSRTMIMLGLAILILTGCSNRTEIDGTNPDDFSESVANISSNLSTDKRIAFINDLRTLNDQYGSYSSSIDNPSTSFLSFVNGKNLSKIHAEAKYVRTVSARKRILNLREKLDHIDNKIKTSNAEHKKRRAEQDRALHILKNVKITDTSVTNASNSFTTMSKVTFNAHNDTPYLARIGSAKLSGNFGKTRKKYDCSYDGFTKSTMKIAPHTAKKVSCTVYNKDLSLLKNAHITITGGIFDGISVNNFSPSLYSYTTEHENSAPSLQDKRDKIMASIDKECSMSLPLQKVCTVTSKGSGD